MTNKRDTAQTEEMRKRGFILVSEAAQRMRVHAGVIYRATEGDEPVLSSTMIGKRKYVAWESFEPWAGELAGELNKPPHAPATETRGTKKAAKPRKAPRK